MRNEKEVFAAKLVGTEAVKQFLIGKVREVEVKVSTSKKITMLSDMLKYEREKVREDEGEWKATKKVLVKEVKSCRAQILALQAERDGFKEQNDMLKRAIVSTGGGGNINKHIGGKKSSGSPTRRKNI